MKRDMIHKVLPKHLVAFEEYYKMGDERSLQKLSHKNSIPLSTLKTWSKKYSWMELTEERDQQLYKELINKDLAEIQTAKMEYTTIITTTNTNIKKKMDYGELCI